MEVFDDLFSSSIRIELFRLCISSNTYKFGETDNEFAPPTGMVSETSKDERAIQELLNTIREVKPVVKTMNLDRIYINCFGPSENPYFHIDNPKGGLTFIYYPHLEYNLNELGETQILGENDFLIGVKPRSGRLLCFDARIMHRATPFRSRHRFTIVVKYSNPE